MDSIPRFCRTSLKTASAEIALLFVKDYLSVLHCKRTLTASLYAHATAYAVSFTPLDLYATLDTNVIFFRFKAVVLTACDAKLELVRKLLAKYLSSSSFARAYVSIQPLGQTSAP